MNLNEAFGVTVRKLRESRGMSQEALADASGLDRTFISMLERGVKQPSLGSMWALADALEIAPQELVAKVQEVKG